MSRSTDKNVPYQDLSLAPIQEPMPPISPTQATQDLRASRRSPSSERDVNIGVNEIEPENRMELSEEENKNELKDVVQKHANRKGAKRAKAAYVLAEVGVGLLTVLVS